MKQKYLISKDNTSGNLIIKEYAELDKEIFSLIFEESYDGKAIKDAVKEYSEEVRKGVFPDSEHSFEMSEEETGRLYGRTKPSR